MQLLASFFDGMKWKYQPIATSRCDMVATYIIHWLMPIKYTGTYNCNKQQALQEMDRYQKDMFNCVHIKEYYEGSVYLYDINIEENFMHIINLYIGIM